MSVVRTVLWAASSLVASAWSIAGQAAPGSPVYSRTEQDCTTNGNQRAAARSNGRPNGKNVWFIGGGCDSYQNEVYERPTAQTFELRKVVDSTAMVFGAKEYFQNLDIETIKAGATEDFLFLAMDMVGGAKVTEDGKVTQEGLKYSYQFLLSTDANGADGYLFSIENPGSSWSAKAGKGWLDTNGDVGGQGVSVTKQDRLAEVDGDGFDLMRIDDGFIKIGANQNDTVFYTRAVGNSVEFALDYKKLDYTFEQVADIIAGKGFLDLRAIKGGPKDSANYLWNDQYTRSEAGSPYLCGTTAVACSNVTKSEFGTQGTGNIYELDTFRLGPVEAIPEPAAWALMISGFGLMGAAIRRRATSPMSRA